MHIFEVDFPLFEAGLDFSLTPVPAAPAATSPGLCRFYYVVLLSGLVWSLSAWLMDEIFF